MTRASPVAHGGHGPPLVFEAGSDQAPFQVLTAEHALIRLHVARALQAAARDPTGAEARKTLAVVADSFRVHQRREDLVMYPVCERLFGGRDGVASVLRDDHEAIRLALDRLGAAAARSGPVPAAGLVELRGLLEGHFLKEERVLFPLMTAYLPGKEATDLARRLRAAAVT